MPIRRWRPIGCAALMIMTVSCAGTRPPSVPTPIRLSLPVEATRPCRLVTVGASPTLGDLEAAYMARGEALVASRRAASQAMAARADRQNLP